MNLYHLQIITHNGSLLSRIVEADDMSNNSDGLYRFSKRIEKHTSLTLVPPEEEKI